MPEYRLLRIKLLICLFIFLTAIVVPTAAMELKIATLSPDGSPWMQKMRQGAKAIAAQTAERVQFKFYPGGIMGNDKAVLRKIRFGQLHGGVLTSGSLSTFSRAFAGPVDGGLAVHMEPLDPSEAGRAGFTVFGKANAERITGSGLGDSTTAVFTGRI